MPSERIKKNYPSIYYRMKATEGTISYPQRYNGMVLWVREHITVDPAIRRRLKEINSTLDFRWDKLYKRWNLVHEKLGYFPYIEMIICNSDGSYRPIDERVFRQLQYDMWWSSHIKDNMLKMDIDSEIAQAKIDQRHDEEIKEVAKEMAPLIASLGDAQGGSHGNSKFKFSGTGESKINA